MPFVRQVNFQVDQSKIQQFQNQAEQIRQKLQQMQGIEQSIVCVNNETGEGTAISVWTDQQSAQQQQQQLQTIWNDQREYLKGPLETKVYNNVQHLIGEQNNQSRQQGQNTQSQQRQSGGQQ